MNTLAGTNIGYRYRPLLELARDATADSYLAATITAGVRKLWVIKLLHPELRDEPHERAAFQREAALAAQLDHPNTAYVFGLVEHEGAPAILMEYLEGVPLTRMLGHASASLPLRLHILTQVLAALHHCHELSDIEGNPLGALHLDLSPRNVMVLHEGAVKVVGFGSPRRLASESGTPRGAAELHYVAPEQLQSDVALDRRADVYAVGAMLWEALAERPLWQGMERSSIVHALRSGVLPSLEDVAPAVPRKLQQVVERALSPDRERRYPSALVLLHALEEAAHDTVGIARPLALADFMKQHFDTERQAQRQTIALALQQPDPPSWNVATSAEPPASIWRWPPPRRVVVGVVALLLLTSALLASGAVRKPSHDGEHATGRVLSPQSERERSRAAPAEPDAGAIVMSPITSPIVVEVAREPTAFEGTPSPAQAALEAATTTSTQPSRRRDDAPPTKKSTRRARAARPDAAGAPESDACTPPYRLTEDGVKAFKPECF